MEKVLGLDLGTDSLGWAIIERDGDECRLIEKGVDIFQEGVDRDQSGEHPAVEKRTDARALRRHYFRRRLRKIKVLRVLVAHDMCPPLPEEMLREWKEHKKYPLDENFMRWLRTDDADDKNPYRDRYRALTETLDMNRIEDRYTVGRAMYHLAQRRGFLSNRKDAGDDKETGKVKEGIHRLDEDMREAGCSYLGEYFYRLYGSGERIRTRYTSRNDHYLAEFRAICEKQRLPKELCDGLHRAIFFQRQLKSQKGLVGKCTFEKRKSRCPVSHPRFEEFRMLQFINNIRVATPADDQPRPLSREEIDRIVPLFMRQSKPHFDFEEIARKIAGKGNYACKGDRCEAAYRFNYSAAFTVSGCPVTAALGNIFGGDWLNEISSRYTLGDGKSEEQILNDVWHALFSFSDEKRLGAWAAEKLRLTDEQAKNFAGIRIPQSYAALSLNAINKILPYLREGYRYDEAAFLANLRAAVPAAVWSDPDRRQEIVTQVARTVEEYEPNPYDRTSTKERAIHACLRDCGLPEESLRTEKLYHPSMIETYRDARPNSDGILQLGSPRTSSVRNPMAMRSLHRLRILVNTLLREEKIDRSTKINIEFSRRLNDANRRKAIEDYQREREKEHKRFEDEIRKLYREETGLEIEPTETDILKYGLWEEQNHMCLYTGRQIGITDFIGSSTSFDIEHTVPRSRGGDDSQMNKTLCENRFNRDVKRAKLPSELAVHAEVMARIETLGWQEKIDELEKQIARAKRSQKAATKEAKDEAIRKRHLLTLRLDYLRGKMERFTMTEVPEGFSNRQGVDIGIIGKYARLYLRTVFPRIYTVKGEATAAFRKLWGLQQEQEKKNRSNHIHHCIDAITIACIGRKEYDRWAQYAADEEAYEYGRASKPNFPKPWPTFTEDVLAAADDVLVSHHTPDNMPKYSRRRLRKRGIVQKDGNGDPIIVQGDTARGALHQETFYGAIKRGEEIQYVVRKPLDAISEKDVDKIVDEVVRQKVREAIARNGNLKTAVARNDIWMNEEKRIPIRKVRVYAHVTQPIPLKEHRDLSDKDYKRSYYVANDCNYCMAVYEGLDGKGRRKREFEIVNDLEAAQYFKRSSDRTARPDLVPWEKNGCPLKCLLKTGTMVLFWEHSPEELFECSKEELARRLYEVKAMEADGRIQFLFHQEARDPKKITAIYGNGASSFSAQNPAPKLRLSVSKFDFLVEGIDFELTVTGELKFKHRMP